MEIEKEFCQYCKLPLKENESKYHSICHKQFIAFNHIKELPISFYKPIEYCIENNIPYNIVKTNSGYKLNIKIVIR